MNTDYVEPHPDAVATTRTSSGRLLDWIPVESQVADGRVATPPPSPPARRPRPADTTTTGEGVRFELDDPTVERGPEGTVPVLRDSASHRRRVQRRGADKKGPRQHRKIGDEDTGRTSDPDPVGYYHAQTEKLGTFYGCLSDMTVYMPTVDDVGGGVHSIYQFWLTAGDPRQSVEAGWTVDHRLNGDLAPHLFTYFTTNNYTRDGDNLGGYNRVSKGWVQTSPTGFPGQSLAFSLIDQFVNRYDMLYMLWRGNWWFKIENTWLGYYPATLFGDAMANNASWLAFGGEVKTGLPDPTQTYSQMGSGRKGEHRSDGYSAWQRNVQAITSIDATGGWAEDFDGTAFAEDSSYYDIVQTIGGGSSWGSYFFAGGPGAGTEP